MGFKKTVLASAAILSATAFADDMVSSIDNRSNLSMTVYANGLAMVQDQRQVDIPQGRHMLSIEGVSNQLKPSSALFAGQDLSVLQQVFDYALMSDINMLRLSEGKEVKLIRDNEVTGQEEVEIATVITTKPQLVLKTKNGIETNIGSKRIVFNDIPKGLSLAPALKLYLDAKEGGKKQVDLTYLTDGFNWKADYIGRLNEDRTKMEIRALATITNNTEVPFEETSMNVIAGDVQRIYRPRLASAQNMKALAESVGDEMDVIQEAIGNFQLFKLPEKVSLKSQQTRQFPLLPIATVDATQTFVAKHYFSGQKESFDPNAIERPQTYVTFNNTLNSPMPAGDFRVYETDSEAKDHFTGEMRVQDTAEGEPVRLSLGQSYNLRIYRKQTEWKARDKRGSTSATYEIRVTNASDKDAIVYLQESIDGISKVSKSSFANKQMDSQTYEWELNVPAKGEASVTYSVSATYL
ncbi:MAG: DUF4139 domain-containing protein [Alphaproteobacteria bacterium]